MSQCSGQVFFDASAGTRKTYNSALSAWQKAGAPATRETLVAWRDEMLAQGIAPATINLRLCAVRAVFRAQGVSVPAVKPLNIPRFARKDAPLPSQLVAVLDAEKSARNRCILRLMAVCGFREKEVAGLTVADVDAGGVWIQGKGRAGKEFARVPAELLAEVLAFCEKKVASAPVFVSQKGGALRPAEISRIAKTAFRRAGLESSRLTAHSLRHFAITQAIRAGARLDAVQAFARHSSLATTMIYNHTLEARENTCCDSVFSVVERAEEGAPALCFEGLNVPANTQTEFLFPSYENH